MSFRDLYKSRHSFNDVLDALKSADSKNSYVDDRFWKPTIDPKSGQGGALIRFLPSQHNKNPMVKIYEHSFQGPTGMWYIEKSLTTIGLPDPVSEYNSQEWMSGDETKQNEVRKRKRKTSFISNIYVIKDPGNPQNEGKVFLFKYGKKIFEKIQKLLEPPTDGIEEVSPIDPFDLFAGANFVLRIKKGEGGFPNYDDSKFETKTGPLFNDENKLEEIYNMTYNLDEFVSPTAFKSYDELKKRFDMVMGFSSVKVNRAGGGVEVGGSTQRTLKSGKPVSTPAPEWDDGLNDVNDDLDIESIAKSVANLNLSDDGDDVPF
ncbi:MAG: single-stranded DNA-binding protein [Patescibacteria group bacterium]|nr:single-stranded DNA-binding protein [Patescibacteria group bacterium]